MRRAKRSALVLTVVIAVVAAGVGVAGAQALTPVRIASMPHITMAAFFLAVDRGHFAKEGIDPNITMFDSGAKMIAPLIANELDVAIGGISAGLFNAIARGFDFKIIADQSSMAPGFGFGHIVVRKDLWDSGAIRSWADVKGRKVGFNVVGAPCHYMVGKGLARGGLTFKDVEVKFLPFPELPVALAQKAVDVVCTVEPYGIKAITDGSAVSLETLDKTTPYMQVAVVIASPQFVKNPDLARRFLRAYLAAVREQNSRSPEALAVVSKWTKIPLSVLEKAAWTHADPTGRVRMESIQDQLAFYQKEGLVKGEVDVKKVVDFSFLPQ